MNASRLNIVWTCLAILANCVGSAQSAEPSKAALAVREAQPHVALNALFMPSDGWIGADGAFSVALSPEKILWLYSDTFVGRVAEGKRHDATMVNNTLAIQEGRGADARVRFIVRRDEVGKPVAFITPADGRGWYWLQAATLIDGRLLMMLTQIDKSGEPGVFGFKLIGQSLGVVSNPQDDPLTWQITQRPVPHSLYAADREVGFGFAMQSVGKHVYIYGTDEDVHPKHRDRHLILARAPSPSVAEFATWEFFSKDRWSRTARDAERIVPGMASDGSVTYLPERQQYLLAYTEGGLSPKILARTSPQPSGPWSEPTLLYTCPEPSWDKNIFTYNGRVHPMLSSRDELVLTYAANSFDFWQVFRDARLYWPKFVRVKLERNDE